MIKAIATDCFGVLYNDILKDMLSRHNVNDPAILKACFGTAEASDIGDLPLNNFFEKLSQLTGIPLQAVGQEMSDVSHLNLELVETNAPNRKGKYLKP